MTHGCAPRPSSVLRVVVGVWSAMGALQVGASSCSCGAGSQGDPHLTLAHGARADFRGRHGAIFNFLSAQNLSVNVRLTNATFQLREPPRYETITVDGTFITEVYVVGRTNQGRWLNLTFGTGRDDRLVRLRLRKRQRRLDEVATEDSRQKVAIAHPSMENNGKHLRASCSSTSNASPAKDMDFLMFLQPSCITCGKRYDLLPHMRGSCEELYVEVNETRRYGGSVSVHVPKMVLKTPEWMLTVENKPVYSSILGARRRLDLRIELRTPEAKLPTMPHGIIGQSWDGDGRAVNGRLDEYPKTKGAHFTTSAMAEGAIEGSAEDYEVPHPYEVRFKYSRFGTYGVPARSTAGLSVAKQVSTHANPSVAGASDDDVESTDMAWDAAPGFGRQLSACTCPPPTLIMQMKQSASVFNYDSAYWTNTATLNPQHTTEVTGTDVKLPAFSTAPLNGLRICVDVVTNCYTYWFGSTSYTSAQALFSEGHVRTTDLGQEAFEDLFDRSRAGTPQSFHNQRTNHLTCMQRPGVNTQCLDNNRARFGFCGNLPSQACQPNDNDDSDFAIGIGCHGQNTPTTWGAGFNHYYAYDVVSPTGDQAFQAWVYAVWDPARTTSGYTTSSATSG